MKQKFIPFDKMSKREQRAQHQTRRGGWGAISPVTRRAPNPKAYDRSKTRNRNFSDSGSFFIMAGENAFRTV